MYLIAHIAVFIILYYVLILVFMAVVKRANTVPAMAMSSCIVLLIYYFKVIPYV